jgi:hypothetical protein
MIAAVKTAAGLDRRTVAKARAYAERYERSFALEPLVRRLSELAARKDAVAR